MNVFIAIIEEAYITIKMKNKNHWIYLYLKLDPNYVAMKEGGKLNEAAIKNEDYFEEDVSSFGPSKGGEIKNHFTNGLDYYYYKVFFLGFILD